MVANADTGQIGTLLICSVFSCFFRVITCVNSRSHWLHDVCGKMQWEINVGLQMLTLSRLKASNPVQWIGTWGPPDSRGGCCCCSCLEDWEHPDQQQDLELGGHCTAPAGGQSQGQLGPQLLLW